jgi:hypothetical protein
LRSSDPDMEFVVSEALQTKSAKPLPEGQSDGHHVARVDPTGAEVAILPPASQWSHSR